RALSADCFVLAICPVQIAEPVLVPGFMPLELTRIPAYTWKKLSTASLSGTKWLQIHLVRAFVWESPDDLLCPGFRSSQIGSLGAYRFSTIGVHYGDFR
ncbi:hypothetical protein, partial [Brucella anthropi]|uniref:hypothetical protein n=1 Tax=Brucella anthropi TaxID=529 RepID=UPI00244B493D